MIESGAVEDRCGVCNGDGSTCTTVRRTFEESEGLGMFLTRFDSNFIQLLLFYCSAVFTTCLTGDLCLYCSQQGCREETQVLSTVAEMTI